MDFNKSFFNRKKVGGISALKISGSIFVVTIISIFIVAGVVQATGSGGLRIKGLGIFDSNASSTLSLDTNNRILYGSDGVTSALSWSSGNVGIGTINPQVALDVNAASLWVNPVSGNAMWQFRNGGVFKGLVGYIAGDDSLHLTMDGTVQQGITINSSGNVGIGAIAPTTSLDVQGARQYTGVGFSSVASVYSTDTLGAGVGGGLLLGGNYSGSSKAGFAEIVGAKENSTSGDYAGAMILNTRPMGGSIAERMRISSTGNVGIGTVSPTGQVNVGYKTGQVPLTYTNAGNEGLVINATRDDSSGYSGTVDFVAGRGSDNSNGGTQFRFITQPRSSSDPAVAMLINRNGYVGVGTTSPSYRMDVNGDINYTGSLRQNGEVVTGSGAQWSTSGNNISNSNSGNVGIGTTTPTSKLDLYGNLTVNRDSYDGITSKGSSTNSISLRMQNTSTGAHNWNLFSSGGGPAANGYFGIYDDTSGGTRMVIDTSGNVGIGTISPNAFQTKNLEVNNGTSAGIAVVNGTKIYETVANSGGVFAGTRSSDKLNFVVGDSVKATIDTSGNLGIGTASPQAALQVNGAILTDGALKGPGIFVNGTTAYNAYPISGIHFGWKYKSDGTLGTAGGIGLGKENATDNNYSSYLAFYNAVNGGSVTERMRISSAGNVGISTAAPSAKLDVRGANVVTDSVGIMNVYADNFGQNYGGSLTLGSAFTSDLNNYAPYAMVAGRKESATSGDYAGYLALSSRVNGGGITERMRITGAGNVGIGTTNPQYLLHVGGGTDTSLLGTATLMVESGGTTNLSIRDSTNDVELENYVYSGGGIIGTASNHQLSIRTNNADRIVIGAAGTVSSLQTYSDTVGGTNRALYIDNTGKLGYLSSVRAGKTNINYDVDSSWIYDLKPVTFNYRKKDADGNYLNTFETTKEYGLIAEDVNAINPDMTYKGTDGQLEGVAYTKLIPVLLKEVQNQKKEIELLKQNISTLNNK